MERFMNTNNFRFDLSPYLIHFFRSVDLCLADVIAPEDWGPSAIVEDTKLTPLFLMRNAIRLERLWATWAVRKHKRTVYGYDPAVCFTDMPMSAFIEAGQARAARGEAMSPFALVLPKDHVHAAGGRPVIYGLSTEASLPTGNDGGLRIMPTSVLPKVEQYRYVTLAAYGKVDWTHEREWRWPYRGASSDFGEIPPSVGKDLPGLNLDFTGMGAIVRTHEQARKVLHDILVQHDLGTQGNYDFVLVANDLPPLTNLREPTEVQNALKSAAIDLTPFLKIEKDVKARSLANYEQAVADVDRSDLPKGGRETGGCWLWLTDASHRITRSLVVEGRVQINADNRYLVEVPFSDELSLADREELTRRLANLLHDRHGLSGTYHSVLRGLGPDDLPSYSRPPLENRLIFNYAHDGEGV